MVERVVGRKTQKKKGLFSFFKKKRGRPMAEKPKPPEKRPAEKKRKVKRVKAKPIPPEVQKFRNIEKQIIAAQERGRVDPRLIDKYNKAAGKLGKRKIPRGEPVREPEPERREGARPRNLPGLPPEEQRREYSTDVKSILPQRKIMSSRDAKITVGEINELYALNKNSLDPIRETDLSGKDLINKVRGYTGINNDADAVKFIERVYGKARLEIGELISSDLKHEQMDVLKEKFEPTGLDLEATARDIKKRVTSFKVWNKKTVTDAEKWKFAESIAEEMGVSPEFAFAIAEEFAKEEKAKERKPKFEEVSLTASATSKVKSIFGSERQYQMWLNEYKMRFNTGGGAIPSHEEVVRDLIGRGIPEAEAKAFVDNEPVLKKTVKEQELMRGLRGKLRVSEKQLEDVTSKLNEKLPEGIWEIMKQYSTYGKGYRSSEEQRIKIETAELYEEIAKETGVNKSIIAAIGNKMIEPTVESKREAQAKYGESEKARQEHYREEFEKQEKYRRGEWEGEPGGESGGTPPGAYDPEYVVKRKKKYKEKVERMDDDELTQEISETLKINGMLQGLSGRIKEGELKNEDLNLLKDRAPEFGKNKEKFDELIKERENIEEKLIEIKNDENLKKEERDDLVTNLRQELRDNDKEFNEAFKSTKEELDEFHSEVSDRLLIGKDVKQRRKGAKNGSKEGPEHEDTGAGQTDFEGAGGFGGGGAGFEG